MLLLHLRYFQVVAHTENMTEAAKKLYISQPALSKAIFRLEKELGVRLFDRKGRNIELNTFGKVFLNEISGALALIDQAESEVRELTKGADNNLSLYAPVGSLVLPDLVQMIKYHHPNISLQLSQHSDQQEGNDDYDFAMKTHPSASEKAIPLLTEDIVVAIPIDHYLSHKNVLTLEDLKAESFIGLTKTTPLRNTIDEYLKQNSFNCDYVYESDDPATVRGLIEAGIGIGFIPSVLWRKLHSKHIKLIHLENIPMRRTIYICWKKDKVLTSTQKILIDEIRTFYQEI